MPPRTAARTRLQRSLSACTYEGMLAEAVGACAGATVLTAWALHLGCSAVELGLLGALPNFGQLVRLPGAWLTSRVGARRLAILTVTASRLVLLALAPLPYLPLAAGPRRLVLLMVAALAGALGVVGNCAWTVWMGDLVPSRLRGRYFGRRTAVCTAASTVAVLASTVILESGRAAGRLDATLSALAVVATLAGAGTCVLMARQHAPPDSDAVEDSSRGEGVRTLFAPLYGRPARRLLAYQLGWNAAFGLTSAFFTVYMLGELQLGYLWVGVHGIVLALCRVLTAPAWGRALDRAGARPVLGVCSLGLALAPLPWLWVSRASPWLLILDPILVGSFLGGHSLASFQLPFTVAPRRGRALHLAVFATAGGLAFALAGTLAGWLVEHAGGAHPSPMRRLFLVAAVARLLAAQLAFRLVEPRARPLAKLLRR